MLLYKYRGSDEAFFKRDVESLVKDYFWAAKVDSLNDPCETFIDCESYKSQLDRTVKVLSGNNLKVTEAMQKVHLAVNEIRKKVNDVGVFSLSSSYDDELLWAHYGDSHKGFCIEFDSEYLLRNINKYYFNEVKVHYSETLPKLELEDIIKLGKEKEILLRKFVGTKSLRWSYENEVRIVMDKAGAQQYDYRAVKSIYFGLRMHEEQKYYLMEHLKGRNIKYFQMQLENNSYRLSSVSVADEYQEVPKYRYRVAPIMSEAPFSVEDVKEDYKKFIDYLGKAIEVARREPYCDEVWFASFSSERSTAFEPVVLVNCKTTFGSYLNYYYALNEIDEQHSIITDIQT